MEILKLSSKNGRGRLREEFVYERFQLLLFDGKKIGVLDR